MKRVFTKTPASGMQDVAALSRIGGGPLFACGRNGTVWRSTDSGATFSRIAGVGFRRLTAAPNGSLLWGAGRDGSLYSSTTAGQWRRRLEADVSLDSRVEDITAGADGNLWVTTGRGELLSIAAGRTAREEQAPEPLKRVSAGPGGVLWAISTRGVLWRRDGTLPNVTWAVTPGSGMEDLSVSTNGQVWLVGGNGTVWTTTDGQRFTQLPASDFLSVSAAGGDVVWFAGTNGSVWKLAVPPPAPLPPQRLNLNVSNQAPAYFQLTSVVWSVYRQNLGDVSLVVTRPQGASTDVDLPTPGQYYAFAEVWARRLSTEDNELAEFRGGTVINGSSYRTIVWSGQSQAADFRLVAEPAANAPGAINPVVVT